MAQSLFARKGCQEATAASGEAAGLRRVMGPAALTALGVGGIMGVGIFVMVGMAARATGPVLTISFLVAAVACIATALCYAEFASRVPVAGSGYIYAYASLGELPAWLLGWILILCYTLGAASVASGWSHYAQDFLTLFGVRLPTGLRTVPFEGGGGGGFVASGSLFDLPAAAITLLLTALLVRGVRESLLFNGIMLAVKVGVLLLFCAVGAFYVSPANWHPFAPHGWGGIAAAGGPPGGPPPMGMLAGAAMMFYAYLGFEAVSAHSDETRRPQRDVSLGIVASVLICAALYVAVSVVLSGMVPREQISVTAPLSDALRRVGLPWAHFLVGAGALAGITSVLLVILLTESRILMAIGRDGLLPAGFFAAIHPDRRTPWKATLLVGGVVALLAALMPLRMLADLAVMGTLVCFIVVAGAILVLRRTGVGPSPAFRAPLGPVIPVAAVVTCLLLVASLPAVNALGLLLWVVAGTLVYFGYGRRCSALARPADPGLEPAAPGPEHLAAG